MSMTDPIADMLTRIRNGQTARQPSVQVPASKRKLAIAKVLEKEGYFGSVKAENVDGKDMLTLELKYYRTSRSSSASSASAGRVCASTSAATSCRSPGRSRCRDRVDVARRDDERAGARGRVTAAKCCASCLSPAL